MNNTMQENVYLIPGKDATYRACVAPTPPTDNAIYFVTEGTYPVEYYYHRSDLNGSTVVMLCECANREELITALNWNGECYHIVRSLWDFDLYKMDNEELSKLFDAAYCNLMDIIDTVYAEIQKDLEEYFAEDYSEYDQYDFETDQPIDDPE